MSVIELDLDAPAAQPASPPPARYFRYVAVFVVIVLVLALGGAAPGRPALWRRAGLIPLGGASTSYQLIGGVLYTLDGNANRRTATAWSLDPVRKLWSLSTPLKLDDTGTVIHDDGTMLARAGPHLLQISGTDTRVIDPATGRVRWTASVPLLTGTGTTALEQEPRFAAGTVYDQSSGAPGSLYFSADGVPHDSPPERTVLHGLDLATGREQWQRTEPGSVDAVAAGDPSDGYLVISAGRLELLDGHTGAVRQTQPLPPIKGDLFPSVVGDVVLLAAGPTVQAFSRRTFALIWQHTESIGVRADQGSCIALLCDTGRDAISVFDPATGAPRWTAPAADLLTARGPAVLEQRSDSLQPIAVRDARTGAVRVDLRPWDSVADSDPQDPILVFHAQKGTARAGFGVIRPGASGVQLLGLTTTRVRGCASDARYVACRVDDGVEVFAYRA